MESVGPDDLVQKSKLSKNHFTRTFKKEYGVTSMVYLNRYRISVAKFLLTTTIRNLGRDFNLDRV